jgi:hypothetical protein
LSSWYSGAIWDRAYIKAEVGLVEERLLRHLAEQRAATDARFTALERRLEKLEQRFDRMEAALLARMADLDNRLQRLEARP